MEILLLMMLAGVTAGVGLWAARGRKEGEPPAPFADLERRTGPKSSPGLPERPGEGAAEGERGRAVVLGAKEAADRLREVLDKAPPSVQGRVQRGLKGAGSPKPKKSDRPLKLTYTTDQIVARSSRYAHHRRALTNAESLAEKRKGEQALDIFEHTKNRIPDEEIRAKIDTNIEDIRRWLEGLDIEKDDSLEFPEIIIPLTTQAMAIEGLTEGLKAVSEGLIYQLSQAYTALATAVPMIAPGDLKLPPGTTIQQFQAPTMPAAHAGGTPIPVPMPVGGTPAAGGPPAAAGPPTLGGPPSAGTIPPGGVAPMAPGMSPSAAPGLRMILGGAAAGGATAAGVGEAVPVGYGVSTTDDRNWVPEGLQVDETGNVSTDGWTDADFDREWEKYKNLPLKDRRSGKERRVSQDRRKGPDALRKDRRSGMDRRKTNLFKERDEFLKKLEKHKQNKKKAEEARKAKPEKPGTVTIGKGPLVPEIRIENAVIHIGEKEGEFPHEGARAEAPALEEPKKAEPEAKETEKEKEEPRDEEKKEKGTPEASPLDLPKIGFPSPLDQHLEPVVMVAEAPESAVEGAAAEGQPAATEVAPLGEGVEEISEPEAGAEEGKESEKPPVQEIHGILELKPPEEDDAPFLTLTYDFTKIPNSFKLSRDYHTMEYAYYKYKPMLIKAQEFTRRKMLKNALNYYRVIKSQNIPPEFKRMVNRNIKDITDYLEKFLMSRG